METGITLKDKLRKTIIRLSLMSAAAGIVFASFFHEITNIVLPQNGSFVWLGIYIVGLIFAIPALYFAWKDTKSLLSEIDADKASQSQ